MSQRRWRAAELVAHVLERPQTSGAVERETRGRIVLGAEPVAALEAVAHAARDRGKARDEESNASAIASAARAVASLPFTRSVSTFRALALTTQEPKSHDDITAPEYKTLKPPTQGETITMRDGVLQVPAQPIIPFIEGDGTGPDIWRASRLVFDGAVRAAYGGKREDRVVRGARGREGEEQVEQLAARGYARRRSTITRVDQGPAHDAGGRRHSARSTSRSGRSSICTSCVRPVR